MDGWFGHVTNSAYFSWLSEYNTPAVNGTNQKFGYGSFTSRGTITPSTSATTVLDSDIQTSLISAINSGVLPKPVADSTGNVNSIYAVYFPSNITINDGTGNLSGVVFCAYHGATSTLVNGMHVPYMVLPDPTSGGMQTGCGPGTAYQNLESYTSHELIEAMTDPMVPFATVLGPPLGWYDNTNGEIGDICNQIVGTVTGNDAVTYTAQSEWSNTVGNCILTNTNTTPGAATNVSVGHLSANTGQLTWGAPASDGGTAITSWSVYRSTDGSLGAVTATLPASARTYNDTLSPGVTYYYTLVASNVNGSGTPSVQVSIGDITAPDAPTSVASSLTAANTITTTWTAPSNTGGGPISGFSVYRYVTGQPSATHLADLPANQSSYSDSSGTLGTSYEYTIAASNSAGAGPQSSHSNAVIAAGPATSPTSVAVSATDVGQLTVTWGAPSSSGGTAITGYNVYRASTVGGPYSLVGQTAAPNVTSFVDSSLTGGTVEYYEVAAVTGFGEGAGSTPVSATAESLAGASGQITATALPGGSASVTWTVPTSNGSTPILGYHVQDNTGSFFCNTTTALSCTVTGLTVGVPYTFSVQAYNRWGTGLSSAPSSPIIAGDVPTAPTITALTAGNRSVHVSWSPPSSNGGLDISQYKVTASPGGASCVTPGTATTCSITGLTNGTNYTFSVVASNSLGTGIATSANATPRTVPGAPRLIKATYAAGHKTTVTWTAPTTNGGAALTSYSVRWSLNGRTWSSWSSTHFARSWTHIGFQKGVRVYVQISASNVVGRGAASQIAVTPTK
jgi:hypothetical protein